MAWLYEHQTDALSQSLSLIHIELPAFLATASPETDAHQLRLMLAHRLNAALVVDSHNEPVGVVTSTDYLRLYASADGQQGSV